MNPSGFSLLKDVDPIHLLEFIRNEHPQTIALILSQLNPGQAAQVLSQLPEDIQTDVAMRIATMEKISPEVINEIESVLDTHLKEVISGNLAASGGVKAVASILNLVDRGTEKSILGNLEMENPELTSSIKNLMFVFEDILILDDRGIQLILKEVDTKELANSYRILHADHNSVTVGPGKRGHGGAGEKIAEKEEKAGNTIVGFTEEINKALTYEMENYVHLVATGREPPYLPKSRLGRRAVSI